MKNDLRASLQREIERTIASLENDDDYQQVLQELERLEGSLMAHLEERDLLRALIDNLPDYIFVKDAESRFVINNTAHLRVLGAATQDEVLGKTDFDIFPQELAEQYYADEQAIIQSGEPMLNQEETRMDPQGREQWLSTTKVPLRDGDDEVIGLVGISRDITERKRSEANAALEAEIAERGQMDEPLRESEQRLKTILDTVQAGIVIIDAETREIVDANPAALQTIGAPRDKVVGSVCHRFICPAEQGQCPVCDLRQSVDNSERVLLKNNGEEVPILKTVVPATLGGRKYLIESFVTIAERKRAEEELARERDLLQALMDNMPDMIFFKDAESRIVRSNRAHTQFLGFSDPQELVGKTDFDLFSPEDAPRFFEEEQEIIRSGQPIVDRVGQTPDLSTGKVRWLSETKVPMIDETGQVLGLVGIARDITKQMRAEEALRKAIKELDCLNDIGRKTDETPPIPEFLEWVAERIPPAMQYPDVCVAAIDFDDHAYGVAEAVKLPCQIVQSLRISGKLVGRVVIAYREERDFLDEESALLGGITRRVSGYIENRRLSKQTQEALAETEDQARRLAALHEMNTQLSQAESLDETFRIAAAQAHRIVSADRVSVALVSPTGNHAEVLALHGEAGATPVGTQVPIEGTTIDIALRENRVVVAAIAPDSDLAKQGLRSTMVAPLTVGGRRVGTLNLGNRDPDAYTTRDENMLLQMASSLASMIENRRLVEEAQDRAHREQTLRQITARVRGSTDLDAIVRTAVRELGTALGRPTFVRLGSAEELSQTPAAQAGDDDGKGMASQEGGE